MKIEPLYLPASTTKKNPKPPIKYKPKQYVSDLTELSNLPIQDGLTRIIEKPRRARKSGTFLSD